jgi:periplasmic protein TonB
MAETLPIYRLYELPWTTGVEQEQRFRRVLRRTTTLLAVLTLVLSVLPVPERDPTEVVEIPQRFASLVLEREVAPPPPPVVEQPTPPREETPPPEPEPERVVEKHPAAQPEEPAPAPAPPDRTQQARERARTAGLLPFAEQLAALRNDDAVAKLDQTALAGPVEGEAPRTERSLITSRAGTASSGINTAQFSRNTGGNGLAARATTQVESPIEGFGPAGGAVRSGGESLKGSRSREEIEMVFDRNKGAIYALYNRALRQNPALEGKLVLRLTIAPDGAVTSCEVVSSELGDPELEQKLVQRVLLFRFDPKDVEPVTTTKPIDFFPA